jgi:aminoglycoside 6-adenylyltransferase
LILVGSRARSHHPPDRWSDADFDVFADDHERLRADLGWLDKLGPRWLTVTWEGEIMTMFEGGLMAGIEIQPAERIEPRRREFRALWDPEGLVTPAETTTPAMASTEQMEACVGRFWLQVVGTARKLGRGELLVAAGQFAQIRRFTIQMLEWHAEAGGAADTWYDGRFMAEWAEPWAVEAMGRLSPAQDAGSLRAALEEAMTLFRRLTTETARRLGRPEPASVDAGAVQAVVEDLIGFSG